MIITFLLTVRSCLMLKLVCILWLEAVVLKPEPNPDIVGGLRLKDCNLVCPHRLNHWRLTIGSMWLLAVFCIFAVQELPWDSASCLANHSSVFPVWEIACKCQDVALITVRAWSHWFEVFSEQVLWSLDNLLAFCLHRTCSTVFAVSCVLVSV